jgi:carbonic anhydrase
MCETCEQALPALSRRRVMLGAGALFAASALPFARAHADQPASLTPPPNAIHPDEALKRLMQGNVRYAANMPKVKNFSAGRAARTKAQYPIAAILSCADSRVAPELAFDQGPGDVFVVRVAGNFVNDDGLASFEYAVRFLGVPLPRRSRWSRTMPSFQGISPSSSTPSSRPCLRRKRGTRTIS